MADLIGQIIDHYRIDRFIGQGTIGNVYEAQDINLSRQVAIKVVHPFLAANERFQKLFLDQLQDVAAFDHRSIIRILAHGWKDEHLYIVTEYISDGSLTLYLEQFRAQNKLMPLEEAIQLAAQIADGLSYAHERKLIHRNLRPDNILLKPHSSIGTIPFHQAVITDFGLAQIATEAAVTTVGLPPSAFTYMAPEQILGTAVGPHTDIYALGVIFYEMVVGKPPYQPRSVTEAHRVLLNEAITPPSSLLSGLPPAVDKIILRCLGKTPEQRYGSAKLLLDDLEDSKKERTRREIVEVQILQPIEDEEDDEGTEEVERVSPAPQPHIPTEPPPPPPPAPIDFDRLVILQTGKDPQRITLHKEIMVIGRSPKDCDLVIDHPRISRRHLRLERRPDNVYTVTDLDTANGTWLGSKRLEANRDEVWSTGEIVRIGDVWLTIEPATEADLKTQPMEYEFVLQNKLPFAAPPAPSSAPSGAVMIQPPGVAVGRVQAVLIPAAIAVEPGGSANMLLDIINAGNAPDDFTITLNDIPPYWVSLPRQPIHIAPDDSVSVRIILHPPRISSSTFGTQPFTVQVASLNNPQVYTAVQGHMQITGFHEFAVEVQPQRIRSTHRAYVLITNQGNVPASYRLAADASQPEIVIDLPGEPVTVLPGQQIYVPIRVSSAYQSLLSGQKNIPFSLSVTADQGGERQPNGILVTSASWWPWIFAVVGLVMIGAMVALSLFAYSRFVAAREQDATATSVIVTSVAISQIRATESQATAIALDALATQRAAQADAADPDGDGLSNAQERQMGTDPNNADTDGDGLPDNLDPAPLVPLDASQPDQFVRKYYMQVNLRQYDSTWPEITQQFRISTHTYTRQDYEAWWNSVKHVIIGDIHTVTQVNSFACVYADLSYEMNDGRTIVDASRYVYLLPDPPHRSWLINAKIPGHDN